MKITRYLMPLFLTAAMFGADAANDLLLTQRNSTNDDNVSRNVTAAASALLAFDGSLVPTTVAIGTTAGTVAAGDDSRITGAAQKASNLSDLASATTARTNLGVGTGDSPSFAAATASTGSFTATATGTGLSLHGGGTVTGASGAMTVASSAGSNINLNVGTVATDWVNITSTKGASSSTAGALTVGNGTAATNVAIGGGNINAGGTGTFGGLLTASATTTATASTGSIRTEGGISAAKNLMFNSGVSVESVTASRRASQGLVFDGASITTFSVAGSGTSDFTYAAWVKKTSLAANSGIVGGANGALVVRINTNGNVILSKSSVSDDTTLTLGLTVGKWALVVVTRSSTTASSYLNGALTDTDTNSGNYTTANTVLGAYNATPFEPWDGEIGRLLIFNRALTAAEVLALYETGTPAGSDYPTTPAGVTLNTSTCAAVVAGSGVVSGASATGFTMTNAANDLVRVASQPGSAVRLGTRYRATFTATLTSGQAPTVIIRQESVGDCNDSAVTVTAGANVVEFPATILGVSNGSLQFNTTLASTYTIADLVFAPLGLLCAPDASQPGNGYQWCDVSGNKFDITLPASGVAWVQPSTRENKVRATLTWAGSHEAKSLLGQVAIPANAVITSIITTASTGSAGAGMTVGSVTTPNLFVTAAAYTTAKKVQTLAAQLPAGTATNDLSLVVDPDDQNYTGTIQISVNYVLAQ